MPSVADIESPDQLMDPMELTADERSRVSRIVEQMSDQGGLVDVPASTRLTSALRVDAVRSDLGAEFSIDEEAMERQAELERGIFKDPEFVAQMGQVGVDFSDDEEDDEPRGGGDGSTFERKRRGMQDAFPNDPERAGLLHKRVRVFGAAGGRPPPGALVTFHYSLYKEAGSVDIYPEPFDSTRMHFDPKPYNKRLGSDLIPGIDWALSTMCKGERAQFHIHSDAFLGDKGALDRIPGGVPILADIELINFCDSASVDAFYSKDEEERRSVPFKVQLGVVQSLRHAGNELFKKKNWVLALHKYRGAEVVLTTINLTSDEEERRVDRELSVLSINKAITLYNLARFPSVVRECNEALKRTPSNAKALLWRGKAFSAMDKYDEAAASLAACQHLTGGLGSRSRASVEGAVQVNNDKKREYAEHQRGLYRRMGAGFGPAPAALPQPPPPLPDAAEEELSQEIMRRLEEFAVDPARRVFNFSKVGCSAAECNCLIAAARKLPGLNVRDAPGMVTINKASEVFE